MPELTIHVPSYIGPSYLEESEDGWYCDWVQGITKAEVEMQIEWAKLLGEAPDSILLEISTCDGGSTVEGFAIYNYLRSLGIPIRTKILALACSMAVPLALAADELPEMDYTAQLMLHSASFTAPIYVPTAADMRAQADRLDNTNQLLTDLLIARTGQTPEIVAGWMSKDTWLTATQAKAVGLAGKVNPLAPRLTPVEADTLITARRKRATDTMARARQRPSPTAKNAAPAAPIVMPDVKKPLTAAVKPVPRAAAKKAVPQARKTLFQSLKELFNDATEADLAGNDAEAVAADPQSTALENGAFLYHDGPLAQGSLVFNDEALTEATGDGDYDTADGQVVSVAAGAVTALAADPSTAAAPPAETAAVAALRKEFNQLKASFTQERDELKAENAQLKKLKPPVPTARVARPNADAPDPKAGPTVKQPVEGAGTL